MYPDVPLTCPLVSKISSTSSLTQAYYHYKTFFSTFLSKCRTIPIKKLYPRVEYLPSENARGLTCASRRLPRANPANCFLLQNLRWVANLNWLFWWKVYSFLPLEATRKYSVADRSLHSINTLIPIGVEATCETSAR